MPKDDELLKYYIETSTIRFDRLEEKVDKLINFRIMLVGAAVGISGLVSVLFQVAIAIAGGK